MPDQFLTEYKNSSSICLDKKRYVAVVVLIINSSHCREICCQSDLLLVHTS